MAVYFQYGEKEIEYLNKVDKHLAAVIDKIGMVKRPVIPNLFTALVLYPLRLGGQPVFYG